MTIEIVNYPCETCGAETGAVTEIVTTSGTYDTESGTCRISRDGRPYGQLVRYGNRCTAHPHYYRGGDPTRSGSFLR